MSGTGAVVDWALISIRLADENDNTELVSLERMCPTGTSPVLQFDRSPHFFARSHVYDNYRVYVAEARFQRKRIGLRGFGRNSGSVIL